jgi:hypothetical protein
MDLEKSPQFGNLTCFSGFRTRNEASLPAVARLNPGISQHDPEEVWRGAGPRNEHYRDPHEVGKASSNHVTPSDGVQEGRTKLFHTILSLQLDLRYHFPFHSTRPRRCAHHPSSLSL